MPVDPEKTQRFDEFIIVDIDFVLLSHTPYKFDHSNQRIAFLNAPSNKSFLQPNGVIPFGNRKNSPFLFLSLITIILIISEFGIVLFSSRMIFFSIPGFLSLIKKKKKRMRSSIYIFGLIIGGLSFRLKPVLCPILDQKNLKNMQKPTPLLHFSPSFQNYYTFYSL